MSIGDGVDSPNQARHGHVADGKTVGFLTDATVCIGCKACEVACKEWNRLPDDGFAFSGESYDNTGALGASTWRHVKFLEIDGRRGSQVAGSEPLSWLFLSDVCKHCEVAGCLEVCPTGAILRTEVGSVYVQDDVCNGCGYCVVGCPFGVIDRRPEPLPGGGGGGAFKCTFCYDRQIDGLTPACAKACPTESIQFGPLDELRERAGERRAELADQGFEDATVYDPVDSPVGGTHAIFLFPGNPSSWGLPARPPVPTGTLRESWTAALATGFGLLVASLLTFAVLT